MKRSTIIMLGLAGAAAVGAVVVFRRKAATATFQASVPVELAGAQPGAPRDVTTETVQVGKPRPRAAVTNRRDHRA